MATPDEPLDDTSAAARPDLGTELGTGPDDAEPAADAPEEHAEPPIVPAPEPFVVGTLIPAVPSAPAVLHQVAVDSPAPSHFRPRRTWAQRLLLGVNCLAILGCFVGAVALLVAYKQGGNIHRVDIGEASAPITAAPGTTPETAPGVSPQSTSVGTVAVTTVPGGSTPTDASDPSAPATAAPSTQPAETFPPADPTAKNFLITGADNNACVDPNSPYAPAFGDRENMGERSDTIMIMRVDPANNRAAILSFPRDLWVQLAGGQRKGRINEAYIRDDPRRLIDTIVQNFGVGIDHFVQVDFCAFKRLVEGVGGVKVPFDFPARDTHTGLYVPEPGCYTFNGDHALAYVRSRYYQYFEDGKWKQDGTSDLGRISRQQDFIRRALRAALEQGIYDPSVARSLLDIATQFIVVDTNLSPSKMFEFAGILRNFDPATIRTYQIEAEFANISSQSVLIPRTKGENMQSILRIFQGVAPLANAPEQVFETTTTTAPPGETTTTTIGASTTTTSTSTTVVTGTTTTVVEGPASNDKGVVPPDIEC